MGALNRRKFLKYAGATGAVVGASALGLDYVLNSKPAPVNPSLSTTGLIETTSSSKINHAPVANFKRSPFNLNPTDQQTTRFTSNCYDADNDILHYSWYVDSEPAGTDKDYSTKLPVGKHSVGLSVSDGTAEDNVQQTVTVESDRIYPTKPLHIKYKGMRMMVGWKGMGPVPIEVTDEKLDIIHSELGCNAVTIFGDTHLEDDLIEAGRLAIGKGFDRIYVTPMYLDLSIDETVERIGKFATKMKMLRDASDSIVFMVGHEFSLDSSSFVPGDTYEERETNAWNDGFDWRKALAVMPAAFMKIISLCKQNYGYPIAYAATSWEADYVVPWSDPIFESVGSDDYIWNKVGATESWVLNHLSKLKAYGKPVFSTEWGTQTYRNASEDWQVTAGLSNYPYDEDEQANYISRYCEMLNRAKIAGAFYTQIDDERLQGYGLYKAAIPPYFGPGSSRKKGFYMYKSYQRS